MASPVTVGTTAGTVVSSNTKRNSIRFQNTGNTIIYLKKNVYGGTVVSPTDYEILLSPSNSSSESGEAFTTDSVHSFSAISNSSGGVLSVYQTIKLN